MFKCTECNRLVKDEKTNQDCPYCNTRTLAEADTCKECRQYFYLSQLYYGYCKKCYYDKHFRNYKGDDE